MSTRLFFNVVIKAILLISMFSSINAIISLYIGNIDLLNEFFLVNNQNPLFSILIALLILILCISMYVILIHKSNLLVDKFKLLSSIEDDKIEINLTAKQLFLIALIVISLYMVLVNIVPLLLSFYDLIKLRASYDLDYIVEKGFINFYKLFQELGTTILSLILLKNSKLVVNYLIKE